MSQQRKGCIPTNTVFPETGLYTTDESKKQAIFLSILCHDWANIPHHNIFKVKVMVYRAILGMAHAEELFSVAADEQVDKRGSWASHISNSSRRNLLCHRNRDTWRARGSIQKLVRLFCVVCVRAHICWSPSLGRQCKRQCRVTFLSESLSLNPTKFTSSRKQPRSLLHCPATSAFCSLTLVLLCFLPSLIPCPFPSRTWLTYFKIIQMTENAMLNLKIGKRRICSS